MKCCDLANFAFGTMVPEHLTSLSYSKQVLFRNIFSIFAENHEVPGQFNSKGAGVPVRFATLLSSLQFSTCKRRLIWESVLFHAKIALFLRKAKAVQRRLVPYG